MSLNEINDNYSIESKRDQSLMLTYYYVMLIDLYLTDYPTVMCCHWDLLKEEIYIEENEMKELIYLYEILYEKEI